MYKRQTPIHLGTGSSQYRWKSDGCCGNVDLHPNCVCSICAVPGNRILDVYKRQGYYIAVGRGCDVDKPRNLAKSVTVE